MKQSIRSVDQPEDVDAEPAQVNPEQNDQPKMNEDSNTELGVTECTREHPRTFEARNEQRIDY